MVPREVWSRVLRFQGESNKPGTAFIMDSTLGHIVVTAKHLTCGDPDETLSVQHPWTNDGEPLTGLFTRVGDLGLPADVAAFRVPDGYFEDLGQLPVKPLDVFFGQDVYMFGYPYGLSLQHGSQHLPFVKKGVLCGTAKDETGEEVWVVDMIANPGFSGGPLVYLDQQTQEFAIAGVVQQTMTGPIHESSGVCGDSELPRVTAGLSYVAKATHVLALTGNVGRTDPSL